MGHSNVRLLTRAEALGETVHPSWRVGNQEAPCRIPIETMYRIHLLHRRMSEEEALSGDATLLSFAGLDLPGIAYARAQGCTSGPL